MATSESDKISLNVEFFGGLDILFGNQRRIKVSLPLCDDSGHAVTMNHLIRHLHDKHMTDHRKEFFVLDNAIRPGILVLINEADWELEGEGRYELKDNDNVLFVSTLHGG